jgi:hypothetical protein
MDEIMPLNVTPAPNTIIRVMMYFKGLDNPIDINEQVLVPQERIGYTVVEWGGCKLK